MKYPKVSIVIVNWNGKEYLGDCLSSVFDQSYPNYDVILVDNGSMDGSVEFVRKNYPKVKIIKLSKNYGIAKGNNIGIREAFKDKDVRYIASLATDTKVEKNWLSELVKVANTEEKIGICVPKILKMDNPKIIDHTGAVFKWKLVFRNRGRGEVDIGQYDNKLDVDGTDGTSCLLKRQMLEEIGLFDESFFINYEYHELSWRAYKRGWKAKFVPSSIVYHKGWGAPLKVDTKLRNKKK